jgi:hypothetical protein
VRATGEGHGGIHRLAGLHALVQQRLLERLVVQADLQVLVLVGTEMHWPPRFRRARIVIGTGTLLAVTAPVVIR